MNGSAAVTPWWLDGVRVQTRTIGALVMRELHTRFGRDNIGYLWLFLEPGLLALGIAATRFFVHLGGMPWGMDVISFYVSGYCSYQAFRASVNRAGGTIDANGALLYHRPVGVVDMIVSRTLLDTIAPFVAGLLIMGGAAAMGVGTFPGDPLRFLFAWALNFWFCFGLALLVLAGTTYTPTLDRFIHPLTYLVLPISNVLTIFEQMPAFARDVIKWVPMAQINEMVREGVYRDFHSTLTMPGYVIGWCLALTLLGLLAVKAARPRMLFE